MSDPVAMPFGDPHNAPQDAEVTRVRSLSGAWRDDFAWWSMLVAVIFTWASAIDYARAAPQLLRSAESQGAAAAVLLSRAIADEAVLTDIAPGG